MRDRTHLVCQFLEGISRSALENHEELIRAYVRRRHGVYALYRRGKLYYVGLASNLRARLNGHLSDRHGESWDRFSVYLTVGDGHLRELEALMLRIVPTPGNKHKGRLPKAEDMRRRFARDVAIKQRAERDDIMGRLSPKPRARPCDRTRQEGRAPIMAQYVNGRYRLRAYPKGRRVDAKIRRDGMIRFGGKLFTSPSLAAAAACARATCNGWSFWQYERAPGDWVPLSELRSN
jgi:hypothetical protein